MPAVRAQPPGLVLSRESHIGWRQVTIPRGMPLRGGAWVPVSERVSRLRYSNGPAGTFLAGCAGRTIGDLHLPLAMAAAAQPPHLLIARVADIGWRQVSVQRGMPLVRNFGGLLRQGLAGRGAAFALPAARRPHAGQPWPPRVRLLTRACHLCPHVPQTQATFLLLPGVIIAAVSGLFCSRSHSLATSGYWSASELPPLVGSLVMCEMRSPRGGVSSAKA